MSSCATLSRQIRPAKADQARGESGGRRSGGTAKPVHKLCGTSLSRLYYTVYSRISRGSRILPLVDWMWCEMCGAPVQMIQRDMREPAPRNGKRRGGN